MFGLLLRCGVACLATAALLCMVFLVRLGNHTMYEHGRNIAYTAEAREFASELERWAEDVASQVEGTVSTLAELPEKFGSTTK